MSEKNQSESEQTNLPTEPEFPVETLEELIDLDKSRGTIFFKGTMLMGQLERIKNHVGELHKKQVEDCISAMNKDYYNVKLSRTKHNQCLAIAKRYRAEFLLVDEEWADKVQKCLRQAQALDDIGKTKADEFKKKASGGNVRWVQTVT